jgi:hypothetical protein
VTSFHPVAATRRPRPAGPEFEDTQPNAELPPDAREIWRDSSLDLEHGLDVDELPIDSLPGEWRDSFG